MINQGTGNKYVTSHGLNTYNIIIYNYIGCGIGLSPEGAIRVSCNWIRGEGGGCIHPDGEIETQNYKREINFFASSIE